MLVSIATLCLLVLGRACAYTAIGRARTKGAFAQRVLIVGAGRSRSASQMSSTPTRATDCTRSDFSDHCADESLTRPLLWIDELDEVLRKHHIDRGRARVWAPTACPDLVRVIRSCQNADVEMHVVPRFFELGLQRVMFDMVLGLPPGSAAAFDDAILVAVILRSVPSTPVSPRAS